MSTKFYNVAIGVTATALIVVLAWTYLRTQGLITTDSFVNKAKLEPAYRAAQTIEGSIGVGVNYPTLGELLQQFNTELSIARDKQPPATEREILDHYTAAAVIYVDSLALWKQPIERSQYLSDSGEVKTLKEKYALPVEYTGTVDSQKGVQLIWAKAEKQLAHGNVLYTR